MRKSSEGAVGWAYPAIDIFEVGVIASAERKVFISTVVLAELYE